MNLRRVAFSALLAVSTSARPRLLVTTDIGGDPDDQQSLVRLLAYANSFRLEGILPTSSGTPGERKDARPRPDLIHQIINAYEQVRPNLARHVEGFPSAEELRALVHPGRAERGRAFIGEGHDTAASGWIIQRVDAGTADAPLNLSIWGGQTDFAQALWRVKTDRGPDGLAAFAAKLRVYDIADQDALVDYIRPEFPGLFYILSHSQPGRDKREASFRGMYLGGDEALTSRAWIDEHVRSTGPLGALYPAKTWTAPNPHSCMKEGDTPSWFFFLPLGGNNPANPAQPGWGGHFVRAGQDNWWTDVPVTDGDEARATVHRHRPAFQADFARRMAWFRDQPPYNRLATSLARHASPHRLGTPPRPDARPMPRRPPLARPRSATRPARRLVRGLRCRSVHRDVRLPARHAEARRLHRARGTPLATRPRPRPRARRLVLPHPALRPRWRRRRVRRRRPRAGLLRRSHSARLSPGSLARRAGPCVFI